MEPERIGEANDSAFGNPRISSNDKQSVIAIMDNLAFGTEATNRNPATERIYVSLSENDVTRGYKSCRKVAKAVFGPRLWPFLNLPGDERRGIDTLLFVIDHGMRAHRNSMPGQRISFEQINESREDLNDACCGKFLSPEWGAVQDTMRRFEIPKQFLFDFIEGLDHALRFGQPQTIDDVRTLASRLGGSPFAAMVKVMGVTRPGYEVAAIECGQALLMTEWLVRCREQALSGRCWLASADLASTGCGLNDLAAKVHSKPVDYLMRLYSHYLEKQFQHVATLIPYLEFDCARSVTAMIGDAWRTIVKLQREPELLFRSEGANTGSDRFNAKVRFLLGLKDELPFVRQTELGDHH